MEQMTPELWISDPEYNLKLLNSSWDLVPELHFLSSHSIKEGQFVRFRGMIQDMADPVIYLSNYEILNESSGVREKRSGKYRDVICCKDDEVIINDSDECANGDRRSYYCITIPGLNKWATPVVSREEISSSSESRKRTISESNDESNLFSEESEVKRRDVKGKESDSKNNSTVSDARNFPIEAVENYSCVVNVYDNFDDVAGGPRLNEVVEFAGFVSFSTSSEGCFDDMVEHLPPSLVPRLHAVYCRRNPTLRLPSFTLRDHFSHRASKIRSDLHLVLTILLLGDSLAAEYLLCNLISRVYKRQDTVVLGKFSVNFQNMPQEDDYPNRVYNYITRLVPKSHYIPLTLDNLNGKSFLPRKDYENNRLITGVLQLSDRTHLFLDETKLNEGQLMNQGVLNIKALEGLIMFQKMDCDFKYNSIEYPMDIPVVVLSEGKSIFPCDVSVKLCPEGNPSVDTLPGEDGFPTSDDLDDIRTYLEHAVDPEIDFSISDDLIETIQEEYVRMRNEETKTSEFDLHNLLVLSRLISLSYGQDKLTRDTWDKAVVLERERKLRICDDLSRSRDARVL